MRAARIDAKVNVKTLNDFDLTDRGGRYQARKAGFDVPKRRAGMRSVDVDALIDKSGYCWEWLGAKNQWGYGRFTRDYKQIMAHRDVYERVNGVIPAGGVLMHKCDNPGCVNPDHLEVGTHSLNQADKTLKGRQAKGEQKGQSILTEAQVLEIRSKYRPRLVTYAMLAHEYGVSRDTLQKAVRGIYWKHL
jgi:hypothetical protein